VASSLLTTAISCVHGVAEAAAAAASFREKRSASVAGRFNSSSSSSSERTEQCTRRGAAHLCVLQLLSCGCCCGSLSLRSPPAVKLVDWYRAVLVSCIFARSIVGAVVPPHPSVMTVANGVDFVLFIRLALYTRMCRSTLKTTYARLHDNASRCVCARPWIVALHTLRWDCTVTRCSITVFEDLADRKERWTHRRCWRCCPQHSLLGLPLARTPSARKVGILRRVFADSEIALSCHDFVSHNVTR